MSQAVNGRNLFLSGERFELLFLTGGIRKVSLMLFIVCLFSFLFLKWE